MEKTTQENMIMKRLLCCLLALISLIPMAIAEETIEPVNVTFEDGFTLSLPADWVSYEVDPALQESGFIYCLGSADGAQLMYVQRWATDLTSIDELRTALEAREEIKLSASDASNGFLMYSFTGADCSGCAALFNGSILNLLFTPQSDSEMMLIAATALDSYTVAE